MACPNFDFAADVMFRTGGGADWGVKIGYRLFFRRLLSSALLLVFLLGASLITGDASSFGREDFILLNSGDSGQMSDLDHRVWTGDIGSEFLPSAQNQNYIAAAAASAVVQRSSVQPVPYMTARIFPFEFTYSFPISPGRKFVRLHFYPSDYGNHTAGDSSYAVSVSPGNFTLLRNFSPHRTAQALNLDYLFFEYSVNASSHILNLTFSPSPEVPNSYAFVNGIEIIPVDDGIFHPELLGVVGTPAMYPVGDQNLAFQTMYRLNVGGNSVSPFRDGELYRSWGDDSRYIFGADFGVSYYRDENVSIAYSRIPTLSAPKEVYETARSMGSVGSVNLNYNLSWMFPVDPGFFYLVRLHFCEIQYPFTKVNQRVFSVYLDSQTAVADFDVITRSAGIGSAVYQDFIVLVPEGRGRHDFCLQLHPYTAAEPEYYDAILNGLEIFKLSSFEGNLAGPNPNPPPRPRREPGRLSSASGKGAGRGVPIFVDAVVGSIVAAVLLFGSVRVFRRRGKKLGEATPRSLEKFAGAAETEIARDSTRSRHHSEPARNEEESPLVSPFRAPPA